MGTLAVEAGTVPLEHEHSDDITPLLLDGDLRHSGRSPRLLPAKWLRFEGDLAEGWTLSK